MRSTLSDRAKQIGRKNAMIGIALVTLVVVAMAVVLRYMLALEWLVSEECAIAILFAYLLVLTVVSRLRVRAAAGRAAGRAPSGAAGATGSRSGSVRARARRHPPRSETGQRDAAGRRRALGLGLGDGNPPEERAIDTATRRVPRHGPAIRCLQSPVGFPTPAQDHGLRPGQAC